MTTSPVSKVREFYESSADWYSNMMDTEIDLPVYSDTLGRLAERIADIPGPVIDTSCGSGHMLSRYHERYDPKRLLPLPWSRATLRLANAFYGVRLWAYWSRPQSS
jgi:hypothetical protein